MPRKERFGQSSPKPSAERTALYIFSDNVNRNKPEVYKDKNMKINASNLCSEIALPSSDNESFVCCLSSMNLELYDEWKDTEAIKLAVFFLDAVMSEFISKTEGNYYLTAAHNFAKITERSVWAYWAGILTCRKTGSVLKVWRQRR